MEIDFTPLKDKICGEKIYHNLLELTEEFSCKLYLVGGILRDLLLKKSEDSIDMDFTSDKALALARKFSQINRGTYVLLDGEEETARVIIKSKNKEYITDFSQMRGTTIEEDIYKRDFTINALAVSFGNIFKHEIELIDPSGGIKDLKNKIIKTVSDSSFTDDPLRILRAYRFAALLDFKISSETLNYIEKNKEKINYVSSERIESELFKILETENTGFYIEDMHRNGLLQIIISEFQDITPGKWKNLLSIYKTLENIILKDYYILLPEFSSEISSLLKKPYHKSIVKISILLYEIAKIKGYPVCEKICKKLKMSNYKSEKIAKTIIYQDSFKTFLKKIQKRKIKSRRVLNFFRKTGDFGTAILLAGLARKWKRGNKNLLIDTIKNVLEIYYSRIKPMWNNPKLITGDDLVSIFHMKPGPVFKEILEKIEEEQLDGKIENREEAIRFVYKRFPSCI